MLNHKFEFKGVKDFELPSSDIFVGIRPEFLPVTEQGQISGTVYSALPAGMETTVKIKIADKILSSVMFGSVDYAIDSKINFDIYGNKILVFNSENGKNISLGSLRCIK